jgi:hypothetical protein
MELIQSANLALRLVLELAALAALGYWGYVTAQGPLRFVLAVGLPLVAAIVWGVFIAPNAAVDLPALAKLVLGLAVLLLAALALAAAGRAAWVARSPRSW